MESIMIWVAIALGVLNALLPIAKRIALKTKTRKDDKVIEFLEEALLLARDLKADQRAISAAKKK